jgi:deoxyribodipyrimidine photolyase
MRQLWSMGWCHNRVRVVASHFMVKHLLLPWQWGLKHLWDCQIDADLECDALGWQYVSGCLSGACCWCFRLLVCCSGLYCQPCISCFCPAGVPLFG